MSQNIEVTADRLPLLDSPGVTKRVGVLIYGVISYLIGVQALLWIMLAMGGQAPVGLSSVQSSNPVTAILINIMLVGLFGLQHSIMARNGFKQWLYNFVPTAMVRPTYVLLSGVFMMLAIYFWQPLPSMVWVVENTFLRIALWMAYISGWAYLFTATFVTNHFELMGLRQVYLYFTGKPYTALPFVRKYMYRYSRHPMMLGLLVGMWALPEMSLSHFVMSGLLTLYIVVGVALEERDLVRQFGNTYRKYKQEIATLLPGLF